MTNEQGRRVLQGVPKVAFAPIHDGEFEFTPFPSCLKAVCRFLGREFQYYYLLGASGAAFRLVWHSERWDGGNVDIVFMAEDPLEPMRRAVAAAGMNGVFLLNADTWTAAAGPDARRHTFISPYLSNDPACFRSRIFSSIDEGIPVIALGVVGPPEASIITGYDDHGETLMGWSMFQDHLDPAHDLVTDDTDALNPPSGYEPNGYFRRDDWFRRLGGILTLEMGPRPDLDSVYRSTLEWIPRILNGPNEHEYRTGTAAYDAYVEKLADDTQYPADDPAVLAERKMVHYDAMTMIAEHTHGASFIEDVSRSEAFLPARSDLCDAASMLREAGKQMESWWKIVGKIWDDEDAQIRATANPEYRRAFIPYVERSRDLSAGAAQILESVVRSQHRDAWKYPEDCGNHNPGREPPRY